MSIMLINRVSIVSVNDSEQWKLYFVHVLKHIYAKINKSDGQGKCEGL